MLYYFFRVSSTQYYVRAGSNKTDNIHVYNDTYRSWFSRLLYHDVALFEVKPPFRFSKTIQPIRLPRSTREIPFELLVCGWGYINNEKVS